MIVGTFGNIVFEVSDQVVHTILGLKRTVKGRYAKHVIISKKPVLEFLGPDLSDLNFEIHLHAGLGVKPREYLLNMYDVVHSGTPHRLNLGEHRFGEYVLEEISEDWEKFTTEGNLIYLKCSVKLKEYS
ncbi:MAG: phage tail protein [Deltaproteobacteria bacterium]|nr:phage tail protein [Deltaproteobacteria bacterium]